MEKKEADLTKEDVSKNRGHVADVNVGKHDELRLQVNAVKQKVIVIFHKKVPFIGMTPDQADEFARQVKEAAEKARAQE